MAYRLQYIQVSHEERRKEPMKNITDLKAIETRHGELIGTYRDGATIMLLVKGETRLTETRLTTLDAEKLLEQLARHIFLLTGTLPEMGIKEIE